VGSRLICAGCGTEPSEAFAWRCPKANGDDVDHVIRRVLDDAAFAPTADEQPFLRYRGQLRSWHVASDRGMPAAEHEGLVTGLDRAVGEVDGTGFLVTPFGRADELSARLGFAAGGGVWIKDETGNVSGSHKGRHLFGLMTDLLVAEQLGLLEGSRPPLAIASCGNAALAAATVAAAARWPIRVFVPVDGDPVVIERLVGLDAAVVRCPREPGVAGDPTFHALRAELADGAVPFTCQGTENGLAIEGGMTLGYEVAEALGGAGADHVVVQVGGGALATAVAGGLREAGLQGTRVHTVQTEGAAPLARASERVATRAATDGVDAAMRYARAHRTEFMWPWEETPRSVATGILDDETYDWAATVEVMLRTGGHAEVVSEERLRAANALGFETTGIPADHTGTAGLAGLLSLRDRRLVGDGDRVVVLFTGVRRNTGDPRSRGGSR
jgi:threonine synthase